MHAEDLRERIGEKNGEDDQREMAQGGPHCSLPRGYQSPRAVLLDPLVLHIILCFRQLRQCLKWGIGGVLWQLLYILVLRSSPKRTTTIAKFGFQIPQVRKNPYPLCVASHVVPVAMAGASSPSTSSKSVMQTVDRSHWFVIQGYSLVKGMGVGKHITSDLFTVGGYHWAIYFYPNDFINLSEFAAFCRSDIVDNGDTELRDAFNLYDQDKNDLISPPSSTKCSTTLE
ncbi:hypothetical protein Fmac_004835 [Flemingia macrophylla]|uniref:MATH domain-containing protein n=1 Tax=Flemingia macrophylla TaxID=520843 RepID=A0ABD1N8Q4_9FABA